ncbi:MAG: cation transporter [Alphaproteobacteria bacterium]|nr:cation transporter [Alphaproteobacteria bacterium]
MKKSFLLEDLDCANCAAKIETAINELENVSSASVSFMSQKLVLEAPDDKFEEVLNNVEKVIKKVDADITLKK